MSTIGAISKHYACNRGYSVGDVTRMGRSERITGTRLESCRPGAIADRAKGKLRGTPMTLDAQERVLRALLLDEREGEAEPLAARADASVSVVRSGSAGRRNWRRSLSGEHSR